MTSKSMDWFLYDRDLRHERVKYCNTRRHFLNPRKLTTESYSNNQPFCNSQKLLKNVFVVGSALVKLEGENPAFFLKINKLLFIQKAVFFG